MKDVIIAITAASYSGNKGAAAMLQSSIRQLYDFYGSKLNINLMSTYPREDKELVPYDFIKVVSCKPGELVFIIFPLALIYRALRFVTPIRYIIERNKVIQAYTNSDLVLDEAGVSFVDSRGIVMNLYAFVSIAVPMLVGTPVVKYAQALGSFKSIINRTLARFILPRCRLICARGHITLENLKSIGVEENVMLCADGAFTMEDSAFWNQETDKITQSDNFFNGNVVGVSLSSVVEGKCQSLNIDYKKTMLGFINYLNQYGYHVLIIANAARLNSRKTRNNDLMVCQSVYESVHNPAMVRWYHKEMYAEEIRAYIGKCRFLVASRFHAMIGALEQKVPVLLIGWSHKYQEVLDMFELGGYAINFSALNLDNLITEFEIFCEHENDIRRKISLNLDSVKTSSRLNIIAVRDILENINSHTKKKSLIDVSCPEKYLGEHLVCRVGYSSYPEIRRNAASGGVVTSLLCYLLENKLIDGAWVTRSVIKSEKLSYHTGIATTKEEIINCSSSIYMDMPLLKHINMVRDFPGKIAIVLTPCAMRSLSVLMDRDKGLRDKIVFKFSLFCSGNHNMHATLLPLEKAGISLQKATRIYYRRGLWRGRSTVLYEDGSDKTISYTKTICAYKNAYFFSKSRCMTCQDHFGQAADISFGDVWLGEMKKNPIKHTGMVIRDEKALTVYESARKAGVIIDQHISQTNMLLGQKRALVFKYNCAKAKASHLHKLKRNIDLDTDSVCKWNHRLAYFLANKNYEFSKNNYPLLKKIPMIVIYYYMCFIRLLLSF